jgi:hypothetical protein
MIAAIRAKTLVVTKQNTINIKHLFTFVTLKFLINLLAINVSKPPIIKVKRKNKRATFPSIEFVTKACASDALPAKTT